LKYLVGVGLSSLWQFRMRNLFSVTIICLSFLILGVFWSLSNNLQHIAAQLGKKLVITLYLNKDLPGKDVGLIRDKAGRSPVVDSLRVIGEEEAKGRFLASFPELKDVLDNIKVNPFPASVEVVLRADQARPEAVTAFIQSMAATPGVEDIQYNRDWVEKVRSLGRLARAIGLFLGGILILASFFIISNVIKLNVLSRKNEIEILRLVGGTNTFIRVPFLIEGTILGILGSLVSLLLLLVLIKIFPLYLGSSLGALQELLNFRYLSFSQGLGLVAAGGAIGWLGSLTSVSKFLKA
jgi:cell division transport system permease protein